MWQYYYLDFGTEEQAQTALIAAFGQQDIRERVLVNPGTMDDELTIPLVYDDEGEEVLTADAQAWVTAALERGCNIRHVAEGDTLTLIAEYPDDYEWQVVGQTWQRKGYVDVDAVGPIQGTGWHVNLALRGADLPEALAPFQVFPETPERVWA